MAGRFGLEDLIAGGMAAATLLLLVFALGVTPWLAVPLAVTAYLGVELLRPRRGRLPAPTADETRQQRRAYQAALANAGAIRALAPRIAEPVVRQRVGRIVDRIDQTLTVMRLDGTLAAAPVLNDHLLEPCLALLTEYVRLASRGVTSAEPLLEKTETHDLPLIERAADDFYELLHRAHVVDLATLGDVLELNLESIRATPRRFTP